MKEESILLIAVCHLQATLGDEVHGANPVSHHRSDSYVCDPKMHRRCFSKAMHVILGVSINAIVLGNHLQCLSARVQFDDGTNASDMCLCTMLPLETYRTLSFARMKINSSSRFFFRQLPSSTASETAVVTANSRNSQTYTNGRRLIVDLPLLSCSIHRCKHKSYIHKQVSIK